MSSFLIRIALFSLIGILCNAQASDTCSECRRVLVFESGTKPSVAALNPKFEIRCMGCKTSNGRTTCAGCNNSQKCTFCGVSAPDCPYMSDDCIKKVNVPDPTSKPSAHLRNVAYICTMSGKFVWRDDHCRQQSFDSNADKKACEAIKDALKERVVTSGGSHSGSSVDRSAKPSVQAMQQHGR